jgi:hypothetical protein
MLFDLRGRGRRRTVKIVYITLALLMGGGLVLFGIGGGGAMQGGLVDAITGSSGGDTGNERFDQRERDAAAATRRNPQDAAAWAALARARVQSAGIGDNFDPNTATYTDSGKAKLSQASDAWEKYLALEPKKPDDRVASLMVRAYDQTGLNRPADANDLRHPGDLRLPGRPDPQGRPRTQRGALTRTGGRAQHPQGLARPGQAAGGGPATPAGPGLGDPDRHTQEEQVARGGRARRPWLPLAPAPL